jgi:hypothetical protein
MDSSIINSKNVNLAVKGQIFNFILVFILIFIIGDTNNSMSRDFFHFGPSTDTINVNIFGININNWNNWFLVIIFLVIYEVINTFSHKIFKTWQRYYVQDPKSNKIGMNKNDAFKNIILFDGISKLLRNFKWALLIITKQFQFIIPQYLTRLIISMYIENNYLNNKY